MFLVSCPKQEVGEGLEMKSGYLGTKEVGEGLGTRSGNRGGCVRYYQLWHECELKEYSSWQVKLCGVLLCHELLYMSEFRETSEQPALCGEVTSHFSCLSSYARWIFNCVHTVTGKDCLLLTFVICEHTAWFVVLSPPCVDRTILLGLVLSHAIIH